MADVSEQLDTIRQQALQAVQDDDFAAARKAANKALLILATVPDSNLAGLSSQSWNRQAIVEFLLQIDRVEAALSTSESGGMVLQNYQYSGRRSRC